MTCVAVIGTGRMGSAMVRKLREADITVDIWNRTPSTAQTLAEETGARAHETVERAVDSADIVLSTLASGESTQELLLSPSVMRAMPEHSIVCDMGTSGVETAHLMARSYGDRFVDSPVSGSVPAVLGGTLLVMASGSRDSVATVETVMRAFAKKVVYLGVVGNGQTMKLALNLIVHTLNSAIAEGLALAAEAGIALDDAYEVLRDSSVSSPYVLYKEHAFLSGSGPVAMALDLVAKDLGLISQLAHQSGLTLPVAEAVGSEVESARTAGFGAADMADLLPFVRGQGVPARPK